MRDEQIAGFICINNSEPPEYQALPWAKTCSAVVVHRMAISDNFRRQGIASELMNYAEAIARAQNNYLKTDTYSLNIYAQSLFEKFGYRKVGTMDFRGKPLKFFCFDKVLLS